MCREEAHGLSSLKPELEAHGVNLYGIVHETLGTNKFQAFFKGQLFLDTKRRFYGPRQRWMLWTGLIRPSVWMAAHRASKKNITGNLKGEGRLLGGLFVIGPGEQGILMEHRETEFGDHADLTQIMEVVKKMKKEN